MAFWTNVALVVEVGIDVDGSIRDEQRLVVVGHVQREHMAHAAFGPQAVRAVHHRVHQFIGVQLAFHHGIGPAGPHQLHRLLGGRVAVRRVDHLHPLQAAPGFLCSGGDFAFRPHQYRHDQALDLGFKRPDQGGCVARMRHSGAHRVQCLRGPYELLVPRAAHVARRAIGFIAVLHCFSPLLGQVSCRDHDPLQAVI